MAKTETSESIANECYQCSYTYNTEEKKQRVSFIKIQGNKPIIRKLNKTLWNVCQVIGFGWISERSLRFRFPFVVYNTRWGLMTV